MFRFVLLRDFRCGKSIDDFHLIIFIGHALVDVVIFSHSFFEKIIVEFYGIIII